MADSTSSLTLSFLRTHPDAAAKTLEQLPFVEVSQFLSQTPVEYAALALEQMLPRAASKVVDLLDIEHATAILSRIDMRKTTYILRLSSVPIRDRILGKLSSNQRKFIKSLLRYDQEFVGAWMNPNPMTAPIDATVQEAINALQQVSNTSTQDKIFAVDRDGSLHGSVTTALLLTLDQKQPIASIAEKDSSWIAARTPIQSAIESVFWKDSDLLPVLDGKQRFIGSLRHADLRKALSLEIISEDESIKSQLAPTLFEDYLHTLWSLATSLIGEYAAKPKS